MLICGEDLGNVPPEVPPVLQELDILGLCIQELTL
jgi:4-alpha-glucanotransferase